MAGLEVSEGGDNGRTQSKLHRRPFTRRPYEPPKLKVSDPRTESGVLDLLAQSSHLAQAGRRRRVPTAVRDLSGKCELGDSLQRG
jgi:hypothetical protein